MKGLLVLVSLLVAAAGVVFVTPATVGVFLIGVACWLCINARLYQADAQHKEMTAYLKWMGQSNIASHKPADAMIYPGAPVLGTASNKLAGVK